jgi:hypothetical protein
VQALRAQTPTLPLALLADEAGVAQRFSHLPTRRAERRDAWSAFAQAHSLPLVVVNLNQPDVQGAQTAWAAARTR